MKTKEVIDSKITNLEKIGNQPKPKSLRPVPSMVAVRSLRPKTNVTLFTVKTEEIKLRQ